MSSRASAASWREHGISRRREVWHQLRCRVLINLSALPLMRGVQSRVAGATGPAFRTVQPRTAGVGTTVSVHITRLVASVPAASATGPPLSPATGSRSPPSALDGATSDATRGALVQPGLDQAHRTPPRLKRISRPQARSTITATGTPCMHRHLLQRLSRRQLPLNQPFCTSVVFTPIARLSRRLR